MTAGQSVPPSAGVVMGLAVPGGVRWWLRSYWLMVRWSMLSLRLTLPAMLTTQMIFYPGIIIALGLFYDDIPEVQALFFATGGTVMAMMTIGITFVPGIVAVQKDNGAYEYLRALPVPRLTAMLATLTIFTVVALPGAALALGVAVLRYEITLDVSPVLVPAALLVILTSASIGFAIGHFSGGPVVTGAISNLLFVFIFLFSPLNYPVERLPEWLQVVHAILPFEHMANVVRGSLSEQLEINVRQSLAVLSAWAAGAWILTYLVLVRRR